MTFVNTTYLWSFLGLLVPLAIHLLNRGDVKTIKVGSVKFLKSQETNQVRSVRLNELLLLILRILIISLLVLVLAVPKVTTEIKGNDIIYLIEPSLLKGSLMDTYLNDLPEDAQKHLLSADFPEIEGTDIKIDKEAVVPNYWQLVHEMEQLNSDSIVVFSESFVPGIKGMRPTTAKNINWMVVNNGEPANVLIGNNLVGGEVRLIKLKSDTEATSFESDWLSKNDENIIIKDDSLILKSEEFNDKVPIQQVDTITITIAHSEGFLNEAIYVRKAFDAISTYTKTPILIETFSDDIKIDTHKSNLLVWFSTNEAPSTTTKCIIYQSDSLATSILVDGKTKNDFVLTQRLDIENVLEARLTQRLLHILDLNKDLETKLAVHDKRVMPAAEIIPNTEINEVGQTAQAQMVDVSIWLWMLLVVMLIVERILSKLRKQ